MNGVGAPDPAWPGRIEIVVERSSLARWVLWLAQALSAQRRATVWITLTEQRDPGAGPLATLLALEKLLLRQPRESGAERLDPGMLGRFAAGQHAAPDAVVDLTASGHAGHAPLHLRPLYDGAAGEVALAGALFFSGTPEIAIERRCGEGEPSIVAVGTASLEAAAGVGGGMDAVFSRVVTLIARAFSSPAAPATLSAHAPSRRIGGRNLLRWSAKAVAAKAVRAAYELCCHPSHWRVGWRFVPPGGDVWSRRDLAGTPWNVLPDPVDHFYADPFPWHRDGVDALFFEDLDYRTGKGVIAALTFDGQGRPGAPRTVLEMPFHLSYPFLMEWRGELFMIPETSADRTIGAWRCVEFPWRWERHAVLLDGVEAADATIVAHGGRLWMFAVTREGRGGYSDTLAIWSATDLFGPWQAHDGNPVLVDDRTARPAGAMVARGGALYRPAQDCRGAYGAALNLMRVTELDQQAFAQQLETRLAPSAAWPGRRIHTLNTNGRLETVDGFVLRPKLKAIADRVDARFAPAR